MAKKSFTDSLQSANSHTKSLLLLERPHTLQLLAMYSNLLNRGLICHLDRHRQSLHRKLLQLLCRLERELPSRKFLFIHGHQHQQLPITVLYQVRHQVEGIIIKIIVRSLSSLNFLATIQVRTLVMEDHRFSLRNSLNSSLVPNSNRCRLSERRKHRLFRNQDLEDELV